MLALVNIIHRLARLFALLRKLLLPEILKIAVIKDDFLNLFFGQQTGEEIARVRLADIYGLLLRPAGAILIAKDLRIGLHLLLENQKVHHLVEHGRLRLIWTALVGHLGRCLTRIDFKRLDAFTKSGDLPMDAHEVTFERPL